MAGTIEARLTELGIELPEAATPVANYVPFTVTGNLVFISGQVTLDGGKPQFLGQAGVDISVEDAYQAARLCGLNLLAQLREACSGDLDRVTQVIRLGGFVSCPSDFTDQPKVINGASDLMVEVFGKPAGQHARFAVGASSLPLGVSVEVDGTFEIS